MLSVDQLLHGFSTQLWSQVARGLFFLKENIKYHLTVFWPPPGAPSRIYCLFQAFLCNQSRPSGQNGDNFWPRSTLQHRFACTKTFGILNPLKEMVPKKTNIMTNPGIALAKSHTFVSSYPRLTLGTGRIPRRRKSVFPTSPGILSWKGQTSSRLPFLCSPRCRPKEFLSHTLIAKNDQFVISWHFIFIEFTSDWAPETNRSKNPVPTSSHITQADERRPSRNWKKGNKI